MKKHNPTTSRLRLFVLTATTLFLFATKDVSACHGVAINGLNFSVGPTGITITGNSDPATCGCGPYWMEVEVACTSNGFTGTPPAPNSPAWGTNPWYHAALTVPPPENCALEAYNPVFIPFSQLCSGTTYFWRAREFVEASSSGNGPWSSAFSFTTPGLPPATTVSAFANVYSVCPGSPVQLGCLVAGGCPGSTFTYQWSPTTGLSNPNIANPIATPTTLPITYTLTVSGGCVTITNADDTVRIISGPAPVAGVPVAAPTQVCSGQSSLVVLGGNNSNQIQWQVSPDAINWFNVPGGTNDSLSTGPMSSALYFQAIVTGSGWPGSGCGTATSPPVLVGVFPSPIADAGPNSTTCSNVCDTLTATGGVSYLWQPGNINTQTAIVCPGVPTTYTVTVTDANGCSSTDNVTVGISVATVAASPDVSICFGDNAVLVGSGPSGMSYSWSPSSSLVGANTANPTASPSVTTTYTVTGTNSFGCLAFDSVTVTVTPSPPLTMSNDTAFCAGGSATLTASGSTTYSWQPGNLTGPSVAVNPSTTTTYTVIGNNNNCISVDSVTVTIIPNPQVNAGPNLIICQGTQITLNAGAIATSYSWAPSSTILGNANQQSVVAAPTSNTSYVVTVVGPGGCTSTDTIAVTVNNTPNVTANVANSAVCQGASTNLTAGGATSYQWIPTVGVQNPNQASTSVTPTSSTVYAVVGTDANGCADTATVSITVNPLPDVYMPSTPTQCGDTTGTITFGGAVSGTGPFTYQIGSQTYTSMPITGMAAGTYTVTVTDNNGCVNQQMVGVAMVNNSTISASASPVFGVNPLPVNFAAVGTGGINNYFWTFGDQGATAPGQNSSYTYANAGTYTVVVAGWNDDPMCTVFDTIVINVVEQAILSFPNVFTPNGDGANDEFLATISGVQSMNITIFDRWGFKIHTASLNGISPAPGTISCWDGKNGGGNLASDGVYYYVIDAVGYDGKNYPFQGFVHLLSGK